VTSSPPSTTHFRAQSTPSWLPSALWRKIMDHQAFAQLLGNYGEFLGSIAVVVTPIYLVASSPYSSKTIPRIRKCLQANC
jgi:hypothetical protein